MFLSAKSHQQLYNNEFVATQSIPAVPPLFFHHFLGILGAIMSPGGGDKVVPFSYRSF